MLYMIKQDLFIRILVFFILVPGSFQSGSAEISFSCSIYNTADSTSESIAGENLDFSGLAILENDLLSLEGRGSAINNCSFYSYELALGEDHIQSAARTDSGLLAWRGSATAAIDRKEATLSSRASVFDGNLTSLYRNSNVAVSGSFRLLNSSFQEAAVISPRSLSSLGSGAAGRGDVRGFDQSLSIEGFERWLRVDSAFLGNASLQWMSGSDCSQSGYSLRMMVLGRSDDPSGISRMEMMGSGSGLPPQILPPGRLNVSRLFADDPSSTIDARFLEEELAAFNRDNSINASLFHWYNLKESSIANLTGSVPDQGWGRKAGVYFKMRMALEQGN